MNDDIRAVSRGDALTIGLLLIGGVVLPVIGWVIGAVRLWRSGTWGLREKLLGILVIPGGLMAPGLLLGLGEPDKACAGRGGPGLAPTVTCTGGASTGLISLAIGSIAVLSVAALLSAGWLYLSARRRPVVAA
ncbi:MAG: hypothetical protein ACRDSS_07305 [Actinocrinis sp.]